MQQTKPQPIERRAPRNVGVISPHDRREAIRLARNFVQRVRDSEHTSTRDTILARDFTADILRFGVGIAGSLLEGIGKAEARAALAIQEETMS